jgi:uncharacterized surface protein with fasciclin (FAS1) repeats
MMSNRKTRTTVAIAAAASALLVLGACSSSDPEGTASADTTSPTTMAATAPSTSAPEAQTIVDVAASNPQFSTLVAAVKAAGLAETLSGEGPFTVFAPTNEAFEQLPAGTVETLLKPENKDQLTGVLTYHVVAGQVMAADVEPGTVKTVNGASFTVSIDGGEVVITDGQGNKSKVVKTDISASNGVIHVIDTVLLPPTGK